MRPLVHNADKGARRDKVRRHLSLYDGRTWLGSIRTDDQGTCTALDAKGWRLGAFDNQRGAVEAIEQAHDSLAGLGRK